MTVHNFSRFPTVVTSENGDGQTLYEYYCLDCGIEYVHQCLLDGSDFEYNDYLSEIPCESINENTGESHD